MTTRLTIKNEGTQKTVRVKTVTFAKGESGSRETGAQHVQPGQSAEFYVHQLCELHIEELP